jgi:hypothetical protein
VYLLDTPLDNTYKNQLHFDLISEQRQYFNGRIKHKFDDVTYNRKDSVIRVNKNIDLLYNSNYVMYCNVPMSNHYFYAFITKMDYVSENVTDIHIETDVYQTWMFDVDLKKSFVVREHVSDDTIGKHRVDEGIDLGDYVMNNYKKTDALGELWFVMAVSDTIGTSETLIRRIYGNVYAGLAYFAYDPDNADAMTTHINNYVSAGKGDAIQFIFTIPRNLLPTETVSGSVIPSYYTTRTFNFTFDTFKTTDVDALNRFKRLDGYIPVNNKMYCYPYNLLYVSNNNGSSAEFHFEDFYDYLTEDHITFMIDGNIAPNPTILMYPYRYRMSNEMDNNGVTTDSNSYEYGISMSGFPLCSWGNDTFNAWLAQNGASTAVALLGSTTALAAGIVTANPAAIGGGAIGVASQMTSLYKASIQPDQARGNTSGASLNIAGNRQDFFVARMSVRSEYAKRIDDYFTMFGYKVNSVKVPNTHSRENWNYIQTIDINIDGAIPADDMKKLKSIYNNGITLWHNPENFCQYEMSNEII